VALREINYHNTLLSVVNESIEVWQDFPTKEDWDLIDIVTMDRLTSNFATNYLMGSIVLGSYIISFRENLIPTMFERYEEVILSALGVSEEKIPNVVVNENNVKRMISYHLSQWPELDSFHTILVYGRKHSTLVHTARPASRNYDTPERLCQEINRVLHAHSITFSIREDEEEGVKLFHLDSLPGNKKSY
jgi:hypothetical protein